MRRAWLLRLLYTLLVYLATPVILYRLAFRSIRARGYRIRWRERFGFFPLPPKRPNLVVHAVSVGEFNAARPLIEALLARVPDHGMVVTTITPTGSERVRKVLGERVFHVYLPYDLPGSIDRFLDRVQPALFVVMETEIWPNLYFRCAERGIPLIVANARLSEKSLRAYGPGQPLARHAVRCARWIAAQSRSDAERFLQLGADPAAVEVVGNVKFDLTLPDDLEPRSQARRAAFGPGRPVWIAASTHEGEDETVLAAHARVLGRFPDALLLLAPRHPERFRESAALCRSFGFATRTRSEDGEACPDCQCFVVDTLGELLEFYACADVAFVAGSLQPIGGHNVLEPASLGVPVLIGPHTFNFEEICEQLIAAGAARRIADGTELAQLLTEWLADPGTRARMGAAALAHVRGRRGAVDRIVDSVEQILGH